MTHLVHKSIYVHKLRAFKVPGVIIEELAIRYNYVSLELITALCEDDQLCGMDPVTFGYSLDCAIHDGRMLCAKYGYPIGTAEETAVEFVEDSTETGVRGLRDFVLWPFKVVIGAPVGWAIDRLRASKRPLL